MNIARLIPLKFVGGPLDGFSEYIRTDAGELPLCVAIPLNRQAGRQFGITFDANKLEAIYRLHQGDEATQYRFQALRRIVPRGIRSEEIPAA